VTLLCHYQHATAEGWHALHLPTKKVRDYPKLLDDSGGVPISQWSGWQFDSRYEIPLVR
jgi:hypothetical protein